MNKIENAKPNHQCQWPWATGILQNSSSITVSMTTYYQREHLLIGIIKIIFTQNAIHYK